VRHKRREFATSSSQLPEIAGDVEIAGDKALVLIEFGRVLDELGLLFDDRFVEVRDAEYDASSAISTEALVLEKSARVLDELGLFFEPRFEVVSDAGDDSSPAIRAGTLPSCEEGVGCRRCVCRGGVLRSCVERDGLSSDLAWSGRRS
jgi:hypothetical protein